MRRIPALAAALACFGVAGGAQAAATLTLSGPNTPGVSNLYTISLITGPEGISSLGWDLVTVTGTNQLGAVNPPMIPSSDPTCNAPRLQNCNMTGSNPAINLFTNPNGLNGFAIFTLNTPPLGPATDASVALAQFDFAGVPLIAASNVSGFDAGGNPLHVSTNGFFIPEIPEPATAALLALGLGGVALARRRRR